MIATAGLCSAMLSKTPVARIASSSVVVVTISHIRAASSAHRLAAASISSFSRQPPEPRRVPAPFPADHSPTRYQRSAGRAQHIGIDRGETGDHRRNGLLHGLWAREDIDGPTAFRAAGANFGPVWGRSLSIRPPRISRY